MCLNTKLPREHIQTTRKKNTEIEKLNLNYEIKGVDGSGRIEY